MELKEFLKAYDMLRRDKPYLVLNVLKSKLIVDVFEEDGLEYVQIAYSVYNPSVYYPHDLKHIEYEIQNGEINAVTIEFNADEKRYFGPVVMFSLAKK